MTVQAAPGYIGNPTFAHPVELDRAILKGVYNTSGALGPNDFFVTPSATTRVVNISPGSLVVVGDEVGTSTQGAYFAWSEGSASDTVTLAAPSGNPRIDTIILHIVDTQYGSDPGSPRAVLAVYQGTPGSSPTVLADSVFQTGGTFHKPGAWLRIADVRTNPGDTTVPAGQITNKVQMASRYSTFGTKYLIAEKTMDGTTGTEVINNIPNRFKHLQLVIEIAKVTGGGTGTASLFLTVNNITSNVYRTYRSEQGESTTITGFAETATTSKIGIVPGSTANTSSVSTTIVDIPNYNGLNTGILTAHFNCAYVAGSVSGGRAWGTFYVGTAGVSPVTRLDIVPFFGNIAAGSAYQLYGWG